MFSKWVFMLAVLVCKEGMPCCTYLLIAIHILDGSFDDIFLDFVGKLVSDHCSFGPFFFPSYADSTICMYSR